MSALGVALVGCAEPLSVPPAPERLHLSCWLDEPLSRAPPRPPGVLLTWRSMPANLAWPPRRLLRALQLASAPGSTHCPPVLLAGQG